MARKCLKFTKLLFKSLKKDQCIWYYFNALDLDDSKTLLILKFFWKWNRSRKDFLSASQLLFWFGIEADTSWFIAACPACFIESSCKYSLYTLIQIFQSKYSGFGSK